MASWAEFPNHCFSNVHQKAKSLIMGHPAAMAMNSVFLNKIRNIKDDFKFGCQKESIAIYFFRTSFKFL